MNIKRAIYTSAVLLVSLLAPAYVFAHNGMEHVMGTVAAVTTTSITVDTIKHTRVTVQMDSSTKFVNGNANASLNDLKPGARVVIHARENAAKKLVAAEVRWGSVSAQTGKMEEMNHEH